MGEGNKGFDSTKIKQIKQLILFCAAVILFVIYSKTLFDICILLIDISMPFIVGVAIAFIINIPMKAIETKILGRWKGKWADRLKRFISMILAILLVVGIIALVIVTVLPQLVTTIKDIIPKNKPLKNPSLTSLPTTLSLSLNVRFSSINTRIVTASDCVPTFPAIPSIIDWKHTTMVRPEIMLSNIPITADEISPKNRRKINHGSLFFIPVKTDSSKSLPSVIPASFA